MGQEKDGVFNDSEKDTTATGSNLPNSDGTVSDEDMNKISGKGGDQPTGQDHSTEHHERQAPREGVGAIQDGSLIEDVAHIEEDN